MAWPVDRWVSVALSAAGGVHNGGIQATTVSWLSDRTPARQPETPSTHRVQGIAPRDCRTRTGPPKSGEFRVGCPTPFQRGRAIETRQVGRPTGLSADCTVHRLRRGSFACWGGHVTRLASHDARRPPDEYGPTPPADGDSPGADRLKPADSRTTPISAARLTTGFSTAPSQPAYTVAGTPGLGREICRSEREIGTSEDAPWREQLLWMSQKPRRSENRVSAGQ